MNPLLIASHALMALEAMPGMAQVIDVTPQPQPKRQKPPKPKVTRLPDERQKPARKSSSLKRLLAQKGRK